MAMHTIFSVKLLLFSYPSVLTYVLGSHRDGTFEYQQHMFWLRLSGDLKSLFRSKKMSKRDELHWFSSKLTIFKWKPLNGYFDKQ